MNWRHRAIIRILLYIAEVYGQDLPYKIREEFSTLRTHLTVWKGQDDEQ